MNIARVFPRRTNATPDDELAFSSPPPNELPHIDEVHISVAFTYDLPKAYTLAEAWMKTGLPVKLGGPAYHAPGGEFTPGMYLKKGLVITSRGCLNNCWFCDVPKREGGVLRELAVKDGWNVMDDNLLACSEKHIREVFAMLARQSDRPVFSGGLEARLLKSWHVDLIRDVKTQRLYCAYDTRDDFEPLVTAGRLFQNGGIVRTSRRLYCYVLIGYPGDTFDKAEKRLRDTWAAGFVPYAMLSFDAFDKAFQLSLKGALSHRATLGTDVFGNITRINNTLSDLPQQLNDAKEQLENTIQQTQNAEQERNKPFPYEQELADKSARLVLLDAELSMDGSKNQGTEEHDTIDESVANEAMSAKSIPGADHRKPEIVQNNISQSVYRESIPYARENGELDRYHEDRNLNIECCDAIDKVINESRYDSDYNKMKEAVKTVVEIFGTERVELIMAKIVQGSHWDGRYSRQNKDWASGYEIPQSMRDIYSNTHPYLLDGFIEKVREKPSVIETLKSTAGKGQQHVESKQDTKEPKAMEM